MNLLIDTDGMRILRKMDNRTSTLSKLAELENPDLSTLIVYCDKPDDFRSFSPAELKLLIEHSCGPDVRKVFDKDTLSKVLHAMVGSMVVTVANGFEVDVQLRTLKEGDDRPYSYAPGKQNPELRHSSAPTLLATGGLASAAALAKDAPQGQVAGSASNALPGAPVEVFSMPKVGTSTHTIFMYCANAWKEAGYKDDKATLDNIRKSAIDKLTKDGLNISTVRVQSARWYQHRQLVAV